MSFVVELSPTAEADLERLFDFLPDHADTAEDLDRAQAAIEAIGTTAQHRLAITPFSFPQSGAEPSPVRIDHPVGRPRIRRVVRDRQCVESRRVGGALPA